MEYFSKVKEDKGYEDSKLTQYYKRDLLKFNKRIDELKKQIMEKCGNPHQELKEGIKEIAKHKNV